MKTWLVLLCLVVALLANCSSEKPISTVPVQLQPPVFAVKSMVQLFVDHYYHQKDGEFNRTYLGKTLRARMYLVASDETSAVFVTKLEDCYRKPYTDMKNLTIAKTMEGESPFGYAIYVTKTKEVSLINYAQGDCIAVDMVIEKMLDNSRLVGHCSKVEPTP